MKTIIQLLVGLVVLTVGTVVGVYVEKHNAEESGKTRFLDVDIDTSNLLSAPVIPGKKLEVLLDGTKITNLSRLDITIHNFSDKDYEKVPVYLELIPNEGERFSLIAEEAVGSGAIPEAIEIIKVQPSKTKGAHRVGYLINTVNRSTGNRSPEFKATFLLIGDTPNVSVETDKKGIETRKLSYLSYRDNESLQERISTVLIIIGVIVGTVLLYGLLIFALSRVLKSQQKKQQLKFKIWLEAKLANNDIKQDMYDGEFLSEKKLSENYIEFVKEYRWDTTKPKFLRKLLALEKPTYIT